MEVKAVRKITIKSVYGLPDVEKLIQQRDKKLRLMQVLGIARKAQPGETDKGPFIKLIGDFKAINLETGEVFRSGACILPNFLSDMIWGAMGDDNKSVRFAFEIGCHYDASAVTKYVYDVVSLMPPSENDELALLEQSIHNVTALPSPKQDERKELKQAKGSK